MLIKLFLVIPLLFDVPTLALRWSGPENSALEVKIDSFSPVLETCIESGLEVRYRYEFQLCRKRAAWFNACADSLLVRHSLIYDAVTQSYKVIRDQHGDADPEESTSYDSLQEAWQSLVSVKNLSLDVLARGDKRFAKARDRYVSVRVSGSCKGEYNQTLARIAYFLTLGLARIDAFSTGWIDFKL